MGFEEAAATQILTAPSFVSAPHAGFGKWRQTRIGLPGTKVSDFGQTLYSIPTKPSHGVAALNTTRLPLFHLLVLVSFFTYLPC